MALGDELIERAKLESGLPEAGYKANGAEQQVRLRLLLRQLCVKDHGLEAVIDAACPNARLCQG